MSHASVIVALSPADLERADGVIEEAVEYQMSPFDENGEWFKEGSRWDYWTIGGRYDGKLAGENIRLRKDINEEEIIAHKRKEAAMRWKECVERENFPTIAKNMIYGVELDDTEETYVERAGQSSLTAFVFLKDRVWNESGRLGWFGTTAPTECERATGDEMTGKCIHESKRHKAKIVSWSEAKDNEDRWARLYFARFIRELPDDTTLVVVDYHV